MNDIILLKVGEIILKGLNRRRFEQKLLGNIRWRLSRLGKYRVYILQSTIYVEGDEGADMDLAFEELQKVFGVVAISRAAACEKDKDAIAKLAIAYLRDDMLRAKSFKVESRRSDKSFPMTSVELSQYVGGELSDAYPDIEVDVHDPELVVHIEVRDLAAYVHAAPVPGAGGMPVGSNGVAIVRPIPVHFFSFPYTSEQAKEKVIELARLLTPWCGKMRMEVVPFTHIQEEIRDKCPEEYFTLIMRRFMMRIAERIALDNGAKAIVTGENLGQVASQTMEAMASTQAVLHLPVLQPLIGMDKSEIIAQARKIGTFETSILPYEDCCTVFTPRHPRTHPTVAEVEEAESALDVETLVNEALQGLERIAIDYEESL